MDGFFSFVWRYRSDWLLHNRFPFDFDIQYSEYSVAISWRSSTSVQAISSTWTWQKLITAKELTKSFLFQRSPEILSLGLFSTQYSLARFFLDILGYFELTPSTYWKHFCTTLNDFFQNADGWIFQFRLEVSKRLLITSSVPLRLPLPPSQDFLAAWGVG